MRPRDTVEMQGFQLVAVLVATSDLQNFFPVALASTKGALWTSCRAAESLGNGAPSARQIVFIFVMDSEQKCLVHYKCAAILAVAFHLVKMKAIWPAALDGAPSGHHRTTSMPQNTFSK